MTTSNNNTNKSTNTNQLKSELNSLGNGIKAVLAENVTEVQIENNTPSIPTQEVKEMNAQINLEQALNEAIETKEEISKAKFDYFTVGMSAAVAMVGVTATRTVARIYAVEAEEEAESFMSIAAHAVGAGVITAGITAAAKATVYKAGNDSELGNLLLGNSVAQLVSVADAWIGDSLVSFATSKASNFFADETQVEEIA